MTLFTPKLAGKLVRRISVCLIVVGLIGLWLGCAGVNVTRYYKNGVVASASPIASQIGIDILSRGGNAFDAAVAVGFALAVTHPSAGNLGGGGFALLRSAKTGEITSLDFRERAPFAATSEMYLDDSDVVIDGLSTKGVLAVGVPGSVAGLYELWQKFGSLPWEELVSPAAWLADTGFVVSDFLSEQFQAGEEFLRSFEETSDIFLPEGRAPVSGDRLSQNDLAGSLYLIAAEGSEPFYRGPISEKIIACMSQHSGLITAEDLTSYQPIWRKPIHFLFDSLSIYSMAPPSSGGIIMGQILGLLEPFDFSRFTADLPEYIHLFAEAARLAFADRSAHLGDADFYDMPTSLLAPEYLDHRRALLPAKQAGISTNLKPGNPYPYESDETTHFSVCDGDGNMVAITTTINGSFGSGLVVAGAGFLLNNEMDDFSIKPGYPNMFGLVGSEANKIEPGKRMLSSMSPTLVFKNDRPYLVLGSPGGSKIITTIAQAIVHISRFDFPITRAVTQPRFHHQWLPDILYLEEDGFSPDVVTRLKKLGHTIRPRSAYGDLQMISIDPSGLMAGASDPRGGGAVAGF